MSRTVHLHVGVAKSGTTYLQRILHANRALLREHGVLYPGEGRNAHFLASMDLRQSGFQGHTYARVEGAWDRVVTAANTFDGSTLISHETFARCTPAVARRAVESFETDDVRVVITARDLARQVPSVWQERLKNRGTITYEDFLEEIFRSPLGRERAGGFWVPQNLPALARRWMDVVGPDRLTLVTVPPPGADHDELWRRFAAATGIPDADYQLKVEGSNPSLGVVESELLRRLNPRLESLSWPEYEVRAKRAFAERELARFSRSDRLVVPPELHDEVRASGEEMIDFFAGAGCRVVGDLADLRPTFPEGSVRTPGQVAEDDVLDLALGLVARHVAEPPPPPPPAPPPPAWRRTAGRARRRVRRRVRRITRGRQTRRGGGDRG